MKTIWVIRIGKDNWLLNYTEDRYAAFLFILDYIKNDVAENKKSMALKELMEDFSKDLTYLRCSSIDTFATQTPVLSWRDVNFDLSNEED